MIPTVAALRPLLAEMVAEHGEFLLAVAVVAALCALLTLAFLDAAIQDGT